MGAPLIISLEGLPGSGKTTTAKLLAEREGIAYAHERSAEVPFLEDFYKDVERYTFETELCFVLVHYHQYRDLKGPTVLDFSPTKDLVFADINLEGKEYELFRSIYDHTSGSCKPPDFTIFLDLKVAHLLERIEGRGREYEKGFDRGYLESIGRGYVARHEALGATVGKIEVSRQDTREEVATAVQKKLAELKAHS